MEGMGRLGVLAVQSPDPMLSLFASLGLAMSAGSALVVDLRSEVRTRRTLVDLAEDGPALVDLSPGKAGVGLISGGGMTVEPAVPIVELFADRWPAVVVRCDMGTWPGPAVPVLPLVLGILTPPESEPAVWQPFGKPVRPPGPGPVLPSLPGRVARTLLAGRAPTRSRWIRAWTPVWRMPWA